MAVLQSIISALLLFCASFANFSAVAGEETISPSSPDDHIQILRGQVISEIQMISKALSTIQQTKSKTVLLSEISKITEWSAVFQHTEFVKNAVAVTLYKESGWRSIIYPSELLSVMGSLSLYLDLPHYKEMTIYELNSVIHNANMAKGKVQPTPIQSVIFSRLLVVMPFSQWTHSFAESLAPFADGFLNHRDLENLPKGQIEHLVYGIRKSELDCNKKYILIERYIQLHINQDFKTILRSMGNMMCFFSLAQLRSLPFAGIETDNDVKDFCAVNWSELQARTIVRLVTNKQSFRDLTKLSCSNQQNFKNCWRGVSNEIFERINITSDVIVCFQNIDLPVRLKVILSRKVRAAVGPLEGLSTEKLIEVFTTIDVSAEEGNFLKEHLGLSKYLLKERLKNGKMIGKLDPWIKLNLFVNALQNRYFSFQKTPPEVIFNIALMMKKSFTKRNYNFTEKFPMEYRGLWVGEIMPFIVVEDMKKLYRNFSVGQNTWSLFVTRMGPYLCGLTTHEISRLNDLQFIQFISEARYWATKCPVMEEGVKRRIKSYFKDNKRTELSLLDIFLLQDFLPSLPYDILLKIGGNANTREIAITYLQSACIKGRFPVWRKEVVTKIALALLGVKTGTGITTNDIRILGCLVQFVKSSVWENVDSGVIARSANFLGQFELSLETRQLLIRKLRVNDHLQKFALMTSEDLGTFFSLLWPVLTADDVKKIQRGVITENLDKLAQVKLNKEAAREVLLIVENTIYNKKNKKAISSIDLSSKTDTEIMKLGNLLAGLKPDEIKTISDTVFLEAVTFIGSRNIFTDDQWITWGDVARKIFKPLANLTAENMTVLHNIMRGFNLTELFFNEMNAVKEYAILENKITMEEFIERTSKSFRGTVIGIMCLLNPKYFLSTETLVSELAVPFGQCTSSFREGENYSKTLLRALSMWYRHEFGHVRKWQRFHVAEAGTIIKELSLRELWSIQPKEFLAIRPSAIRGLPTDVFKNLNVSQISAMHAAQISAVTPAQLKALEGKKLAAFKATSDFGEDPDINILYQRVRKEASKHDLNGAPGLHVVKSLWLISSLLTLVLFILQ